METKVGKPGNRVPGFCHSTLDQGTFIRFNYIKIRLNNT